jgi:hypothetical protein
MIVRAVVFGVLALVVAPPVVVMPDVPRYIKIKEF